MPFWYGGHAPKKKEKKMITLDFLLKRENFPFLARDDKGEEITVHGKTKHSNNNDGSKSIICEDKHGDVQRYHRSNVYPWDCERDKVCPCCGGKK